MNLNELKREITYKWRVQSFSKNKPAAQCVAYLDSRLAQDLLDEVVGPENWQDKYYEVKGNLFCSIGIRVKGIWRWKTDCGTESNVDKQKGEASDAFKRAAVKWGIGRFLYAKDLIWVPASEKKAQGNYPFVVDDKGKRIWDLTEYINKLYPPKPQKPKTLQASDIDNVWDGTIQESVTIENQNFILTSEQSERLKQHKKYQGEK